jgi:predicted secreted protein
MAIPVKNTTGWVVGGQMIHATDGAPFVGAVTAYVSKDGATEVLGTVGGGVCTSAGSNGFYVYFPSQAETNANLVAVTMIGVNAVPHTVQIPTVVL